MTCVIWRGREGFFHTCMHPNEALITLFLIHEAVLMRDHATAYDSDRGLAPWEFCLMPFFLFLSRHADDLSRHWAPSLQNWANENDLLTFLGGLLGKGLGQWCDDSADGAHSLTHSHSLSPPSSVWPRQRSDDTPAPHSVSLPSM